jgi:hypothetical protein
MMFLRSRTYFITLVLYASLMGLVVERTVAGAASPPLAGDPSLRDLESRIPDFYDISGTVVDGTSELPPDFFDKLAAAESEDAFVQVLKSVPRPCRIAPNVVVALQGDSVTRRTVTDSQGKFKFPLLRRGVYEVSAEATSQSSLTGVRRLATGHTQIELNSHCNVELTLSADLIVIRGRIADIQGRPIAGAKVTAIQVLDDPSNMFYPQTYSSMSDTDGSYELQGIEPSNVWNILRYLVEPNPGQLGYVDIRVDVPGFVQSKENVPRVALVTEEWLCLARRFLAARAQMAKRAGKPMPREKEGLTFPSSQGNAISASDIMLERAGTGK